MATNKKNLTDMELEQILFDSRFTNERHKEALRDRLSRIEIKQADSYFEVLSEEDLELAAGGRKDPEEDRNLREAELADADWEKRMERPW